MLTKLEEVKQMELQWKEPIKIPDGKHEGRIIKVLYRTEPYEYTDVIIKPYKHDIEIKYGCPTILTENSKLGRLLAIFGEYFKKDKISNPESILKGRRCEFITMMRKSIKTGKEYAEIVEDSVKPITVEDSVKPITVEDSVKPII